MARRGPSGLRALVTVGFLAGAMWGVLQLAGDLGGEEADAAPRFAQVERVVDGDTLVLDEADHPRVRVLGVDTPEVGGAEPECGAEAASRLARRLVEGKTVTLTPDPSQADADRYGRLLRYVTLADDRDLSEILLSRGWARVYAPAGEVERQADYDRAEEAARDARRGIWDRCSS